MNPVYVLFSLMRRIHSILRNQKFYILDNVIKVWRVYPFVQEALAPLMSFFCAHLPLHMTMIKTHLCVAFQDHATATYSIVMYNLRDRSKYPHYLHAKLTTN